MNWKTKSGLFRAIDQLPIGLSLHYGLQRYVTRNLPRRLQTYPIYLSDTLRHWKSLRARARGSDLYLEFGAGWDLFNSLALYCLGIERQLVVDLTNYMRPIMVNAVIKNFQSLPPDGAVRRPERLLTNDPLGQLQAHYGITYRAPSDARAMALDNGSVGLCSTTNTLEHVPPDDLKKIMREVRRVSCSDAVISMRIDYGDHYSYSDRTISPYNFLQFSADRWESYNPKSHYQSRLRHPAYRSIFLDSGFQIVSEECNRPSDWERMLANVTLDDEFKSMPIEDVAITAGWFVLCPSQ